MLAAIGCTAKDSVRPAHVAEAADASTEDPRDNPTSILDASPVPEVNSACEPLDVVGTPVSTRVVFAIEQSERMTAPFGKSTRWQALQDALFERDGTLASWQQLVRFGQALYSGGAAPAQCPVLASVTPEVESLAAMSGAFSTARPAGSAPTAAAVDQIVRDSFARSPERSHEQDALILVTAGPADACDPDDRSEGDAATAEAVKRAFTAGIRSFVLNLGEERSDAEIQAIANAGASTADNLTLQKFWNASDEPSLKRALSEIIREQLSCDFRVVADFPEQDPCLATVTLNDRKLDCDSPLGWLRIDTDHIRVFGPACEDRQADPHAVLRVRATCTHHLSP